MAAEEERSSKGKMKNSISRACIFVDRYMRGDYGFSDDIGRYINKYEKKLRPVIAEAAYSRLIKRINLQNLSRGIKGIQGLKGFIKNDEKKEIQKDIMNIYEKYKEKRRENYLAVKSEIETPLRKRLMQDGISGSAVKVRVESSPQWRKTLYTLDKSYSGLLDAVKKEFGE